MIFKLLISAKLSQNVYSKIFGQIQPIIDQHMYRRFDLIRMLSIPIPYIHYTKARITDYDAFYQHPLRKLFLRCLRNYRPSVPRSTNPACMRSFLWKTLQKLHLQDCFSKEDHFFPSLLHDQVLNHEPLLILPTTTSSSKKSFPNCIFLVSCGTSN